MSTRMPTTNVALANLFIDPTESARLKLILRYQTSVQREYDKATLEFKRARAEREQAQFDEVFVGDAELPPASSGSSHRAGWLRFAIGSRANTAAATPSTSGRLRAISADASTPCVTLEFPMPEKPYDHKEIELKWHERWSADPDLYKPAAGPLQAQILRARNAAVSERHAAHRPPPQLLHRRRARPLQVDARLQRAASDGLGRVRSAGRERRDQEQPAAA